MQGDGQARARLPRDEAQKREHKKSGRILFQSLLDAGVIETTTGEDGGKRLSVATDLQDDFSLNHALSLYLLDTIGLLGREIAGVSAPASDASRVNSRESRAGVDEAARPAEGREVAELKAAGVEYEQRIEELRSSNIQSPTASSSTARSTPSPPNTPGWAKKTSAPKSVAREMYEGFFSFAEYVKEYELERAEGLVLRYLSDVYKAFVQTVPALAKDEGVLSKSSRTSAPSCGRSTRACSTNGSACASPCDPFEPLPCARPPKCST